MDSTERGHLIAQVHNTSMKWSIWIMKNLNEREFTIARDNLLITDVESGLKRRVPKSLLECSMQNFHNEIIASPDDGGLIGAIHADKNDVITSDTMICSLAPPQLLPMTDHQKIMCGCTIFKASNYFQELLNAWWQKQLKTTKYKADSLRGREEYELTQAYKSYANYAFPKYETRHPRCKNAEDSVLCTPTNDE